MNFMSDLERRPNEPLHLRVKGHDDLVEAFFGQYQDSTLAAYRGDLLDFCDFLEVDEVHVAAAELLGHGRGHANATALAYRKDLRARGLAPATINRRLASLRSLASFAESVAAIEWTLKVKNVKQRRHKDTTGPGKDVVRAMVARLLERGDDKARRDMAILRLLFDLGLRRSEVVAIDVDHLDLDNRRVQLRRKGHRDEPVWVTLPDPTCSAICEWLAARDDSVEPLFYNMHRDPNVAGARLTGRGLGKIVKQLGKKVGVANVRPHGIRHTSITTALDVTDDPRSVRKFSAHAKLETLTVYDDQRQDVAGEIARKVADQL